MDDSSKPKHGLPTAGAVMRRRDLLAGLAALGAAPALADQAPLSAPRPQPRKGLTPPSGAELADRAGPTGLTGYALMDLANGAVLEAANVDSAFMPASVAKAPTMVYALDALGPTHRFDTRLLATGPIQGGVLQGDLYLQGRGDPELDTDALAELARALAGAGVRQVGGRFLVDQSHRALIDRIDPTQPDHVPYNPAVGALNLNFNRVFLGWSRKGGSYDVVLEARAEAASPPARTVSYSLRNGTSGTGLDIVYQDRAADEHWVLYTGGLRRRGSLWLPIRRPGTYAGSVFRSLAAQSGVRLPKVEQGTAPASAQVISQLPSRNLSEIGVDMLRFSTNMTAELLGQAAASARGEGASNLAASGAAMSAWFNGLVGGGAPASFANHSGLSAASRVTPRQMLSFFRQTEARLSYLLPLRPPPATKGAPPPPDAAIRAKTGTMYFGRGLGGYIYGAGGQRLAFVIFSSDLTRRAQLDRSSKAARRYSPGGETWLRQARRFERALLESWVRRFAA